MLPGKRINRLNYHKLDQGEIQVLKLAAIYGANGAGKSNIIRVMDVINRFVTSGNIPLEIIKEKFKLSEEASKMPVQLQIEFSKRNEVFIYDIEFMNAVVSREELFASGAGNKKNELIFSRFTTEGNTKITFFNDFNKSVENKALHHILETTLVKPSKCAFNILNSLNHKGLERINKAFKWFEENIQIISPDAKPAGLPHELDRNQKFKEFADRLVGSFSTGVVNICIDKKPIEESLEIDKTKLEKLTAGLTENPNGIAVITDDIVAVNEGGKLYTKRLHLNHYSTNNNLVRFNLNEESDGTIRLLEYVPAIQEIIEEEVTYIIDEIERSIHPLIIKEIISKFSLDEKTRGQLIFTTHESNLLDQDIFRPDEIWFVEKKDGATEIYPLSDFKEHHTIDIRKGYLTGRYGAIPFLGNLKDLHWDIYP